MTSPQAVFPVRLTGELDPDVGRWQWLFKWLLAIPHFIVLFFLWIGFVLLSVGQPFGCVANVAAIPTAATTASVMVMPAITSGFAITVWRNRGCQGNRSMVPSSVVWATCPSPFRR